MNLSDAFAIDIMVLGTAFCIGVPVFLWNVHRRLRDLEFARDAKERSQPLSAGRANHPT